MIVRARRLTRCPNVLNDMSVPISSPIAISAIPSTATAVTDNKNTLCGINLPMYFITEITDLFYETNISHQLLFTTSHSICFKKTSKTLTKHWNIQPLNCISQQNEDNIATLKIVLVDVGQQYRIYIITTQCLKDYIRQQSLRRHHRHKQSTLLRRQIRCILFFLFSFCLFLLILIFLSIIVVLKTIMHSRYSYKLWSPWNYWYYVCRSNCWLNLLT